MLSPNRVLSLSLYPSCPLLLRSLVRMAFEQVTEFVRRTHDRHDKLQPCCCWCSTGNASRLFILDEDPGALTILVAQTSKSPLYTLAAKTSCETYLSRVSWISMGKTKKYHWTTYWLTSSSCMWEYQPEYFVFKDSCFYCETFFYIFLCEKIRVVVKKNLAVVNKSTLARLMTWRVLSVYGFVQNLNLTHIECREFMDQNRCRYNCL